MAIRGEVVIECDEDGCHAECVLPARVLVSAGVLEQSNGEIMFWRIRHARWTCPQCIEEEKQDA